MKTCFSLKHQCGNRFFPSQKTQRAGSRFNLVPRAFPWENGRGGDCFTSVPLPLFDSLCVVTSIGRLLGKIYVFLTPSKTDGRVPSQQGVPTTCNLTYWEVSQQRYLQPLLTGLGEATGQNSDLQWGVEGGIETWVWPKGEFIPSGGGEVSGKKLMPDILHIKSQQTPTVIFFQATLSIFGHITSSKLPSSKIFLETDLLGAPDACYGCKKFWSTCWFPYLFIF